MKTPVGVAVKLGVDANQPCVAHVYKGPDYESCIISAQQRNAKRGGDTGPYDLGLYFDAWFTMDTLARRDEPATIDLLQQAGAAAKPVAARFFKLYRDVQKKVGVTDDQLIALYQLNEPQQLKVRIAAAARGYDLALIAELNLNDIKGIDAPSLDAWSTAAALAAVTRTLELMVAVRPTFHPPTLFAKQAANIDHISNGRLALDVVSSWWEQEARMYGVDFERHDDRYGRTAEWLEVVNGLWSQKTYSHAGRYYRTEQTVLEPKPVRAPRPPIDAGGESEAAKDLIARTCDAYVMHGDSPAHVAAKIADMNERRNRLGLGRMTFGVAGYAFTRDTDREVKQELERITNVQENAKGYANYQQWLQGTQLEHSMSIEEYRPAAVTPVPARGGDAIVRLESISRAFGAVVALHDVRRARDKNKPVFKTLVAAYQSDEIRQFILKRFDGAILPLF